jgi:hypothetical protein
MGAIDTRRIPLRARDGSVRAYALVDAEDYDALAAFRWHLAKGYPGRMSSRTKGPRGVITMHRQLLGLAAGDPREGDHINGHPCDNRRENLRVVNKAGNMQNLTRLSPRNASGYRGVHWHKGVGRWRAMSTVCGRRFHHGFFDDPREAAAAAAAFRREQMPYSPEARAA